MERSNRTIWSDPNALSAEYPTTQSKALIYSRFNRLLTHLPCSSQARTSRGRVAFRHSPPSGPRFRRPHARGSTSCISCRYRTDRRRYGQFSGRRAGRSPPDHGDDGRGDGDRVRSHNHRRDRGYGNGSPPGQRSKWLYQSCKRSLCPRHIMRRAKASVPDCPRFPTSEIVPQAALLVFLAAAAGAGLVATDLAPLAHIGLLRPTAQVVGGLLL